MKGNSPERWKRIGVEKGPDLPLFEAEIQMMENPRNQELLRAIVLKLPDTVNVIAVTSDHQWILVEQFRFGISDNLIELPAGLCDADEAPIDTARRELLEETGYTSNLWYELGVSYLNPAYVNNRCFHFLAISAVFVGPGQQDRGEHLMVRMLQVVDLHEVVGSAVLQDAVGQAALKLLADRLREGL